MGVSKVVSMILFLAMAVCGFLFKQMVNAISMPSTGQNLQAQYDQPTNQATVNNCPLSADFPPSILTYCDIISTHALKNNLDPILVAALILQESGGQPEVISSSGAVGLMQVMPNDGIAATFMCPNGPCFAGRPDTSALMDPDFNVEFGTSMLAGLVNRTGSLREALRSYGPYDVGYYYADIILQLYDAYSG